jgi:Uncharacterized conserved protein (COG2071)
MGPAHRLKRHPIPMVAHFRHSLVLTWALPAERLRPLLPPGLELDAYDSHGLVAIAVVRAERLRPAGTPRLLGATHLLAGYRLFVRHRGADGRRRRGLHILRSHADRASMVAGGNLLTHYRYRRAALRCEERDGRLEVAVRTRSGDADLDVVADLANLPGPLPPGSPFASAADARRYAGPLPWTFDYEPGTDSIVMIHGRRSHWEPQSVAVTVRACGFFAHGPLAGCTPVLANAFHVAGVDYRWDRGVRVPVGRP